MISKRVGDLMLVMHTNSHRDIIDHTHIEGNVNKMLLGSFDSYWDEESLSRDPNHFPTPSRT